MKSLVELIQHKENHRWLKLTYQTLKPNQKENFLKAIVIEDVVFAAQCQISDAYNKHLENIVFEQAFQFAHNFSDKTKSRMGLLALVELKRYDVVQTLFNNTSKPFKELNPVLSTVFSSIDESNFIKFIDLISDYKDLGKMVSTILFYRGEISLSVHSRPVIKKFISKLINKGYCAFLRVFVETYRLWRDFEYYADKDIPTLIDELLSGGISELSFAAELAIKKDFQAAELISERAIKMEMQTSELPSPTILLTKELANRMISLAIDGIKTKTKKKVSRKGAKLALRIANLKEIYENTSLNDFLNIVLFTQSKKNANFVEAIKKFGLYEYLERVPDLVHFLDGIPGYQGFREIRSNQSEQVGWENRITRTAPKDFELSINSLEFKKIFSKIISDQGKLIPDSEKMYWELFFSYSLDHSPMPLIQSYMNIFLKQYGSSVLLEDLREMCRILKEFSHVGLIKSIHEYGIYVHPLTFKSKNLLFLHLNHIEIYLPDGMGVDNMIGQEIDFRIIGFKPEPTERINITMLSDEQIELQIREANNNF